MRRVHFLSTVGDTFTTVALAGSLFFSISPNAARSKITLYLLLTVAPFGIVAPFLGPILDRNRGSRRFLISMSLIVRCVLMFFMARDIKSLLLFPEAFTVLVASKTYLVAKAALIPDLAKQIDFKPEVQKSRRWKSGQNQSGNPNLVAVNSGISLLAAVSGFFGGAIAAGILKTPHLGSPWVLRVGLVIFAFGVTQVRHLHIKPSRPRREGDNPQKPSDPTTDPNRNLRLPDDQNSQSDEPSDGTARPRSPQSVLLAAAAMSVLRGSVGFFTFFIAFNLRRTHAPAYYFALILAASAVGSATATALTPKIRRLMQEEILLITGLVFEAVLGVVGAAINNRQIEVLLALIIGFVASSGKLAFDSLVQYNVDPLLQGRAFARFETRFQLSWVAGGLIPTIVVLPIGAGDLTLAFTAIVAATSFASGRNAVKNITR